MKKTAMALVLLALAALALAGCAAKSAESEVKTAASPTAAEGLRIETSALSSEPAFIDWTQDGTAMQLIALKGADGGVRLAYNTCQSCNGSPYAYFEYLGQDTLQCQNCGLTFSTDTVGTAQAAGCNPFTISEFSRDGDAVIVPERVLRDGAKLFSNWKVFD